MKIHVHIERLVLDGLPVDRRSAGQVQAAVEQELSRLMAAGQLPAGVLAGGAMPVLQAPPIAVAAGTSGANIGTAIAQSLHGGIQS